MGAEPNEEVPAGRMSINIPTDLEVGKPADFVSVWHTPNAFLLDFVVLKRPPEPQHDDEGNTEMFIDAVVSSRVRIPPEQVFPLIEALRTQSQMWLAETGRTEVPQNWMGPSPD